MLFHLCKVYTLTNKGKLKFNYETNRITQNKKINSD